MNRHLFIFLMLPLMALLMTACNDDDANADQMGDMTLKFSPVFDDEPLQIVSGRYDYIDGSSSLLFSLFQFYVSDIQLIPRDGGDAVLLSEIELIRWNTENAEGDISFDFTDLPAGDYQLRFGLGVKPELNARHPNEFAADYVLNEDEFWNETTRYVFAKIEGNAELEGDGLYDTPLTYHMGKDDFYTILTYNPIINIDPDLDQEVLLRVDLQGMMAESDTDYTDISDETTRIIHNPNSPVTAKQWTNLRQAIAMIR